MMFCRQCSSEGIIEICISCAAKAEDSERWAQEKVCAAVVRAEAAEKRAAELQALVDAATAFDFGHGFSAEQCADGNWQTWTRHGRHRGGFAIGPYRQSRNEAIALARKLAAKERAK